MTPVAEIEFIRSLSSAFPRSARQVNAPQESDAELIRVPGTDGLLAVTTDTLSEELALGLYTDPYTIGWMAVLCNASDLAAVGAEPIGILLTESLPADRGSGFRNELQRGVREASIETRLPVLGGDTNEGATLHVGGTAIGWIGRGEAMTRIGCSAGDLLCVTGPLGLGSVLALSLLETRPRSAGPQAYRPASRLAAGRLLHGVATACMDTSDGALAAADQLARLNHVGFDLRFSPADVLHREALRLVRSRHWPPWLPLAGLHGEYELLFTVRPSRMGELSSAAARQGWRPLPIGVATREPGIRWVGDSAPVDLDTGAIRNLFFHMPSSLTRLLADLSRLARPLVMRPQTSEP